MPPDSPPAALPAPDPPIASAPTPPGLLELFVAFAKMSLAGFGGVLVWARRGIVEQHRWMTADEFNETFALCHFLPGPNIVNLSGGVRIPLSRHSRRHRGLRRAGRTAGRDRDASWRRSMRITAKSMRLRRILAGVSCAAVGLLIAVVFRMMMPLIKKRDLVGLLMLAAVFVAIGLLRLPLPAVLLVAIPLSIAITFVMRRRVAA